MEIKARGMTFDVYESGPSDGPPVLLLHGFPQDHREFDLVAPKLNAAGLRTYALDQRGYSPGARPTPVADYKLSEPAADAVAVLDALEIESAHVIGHDWGSQVSWQLAAHQQPQHSVHVGQSASNRDDRISPACRTHPHDAAVGTVASVLADPWDQAPFDVRGAHSSHEGVGSFAVVSHAGK